LSGDLILLREVVRKVRISESSESEAIFFRRMRFVAEIGKASVLHNGASVVLIKASDVSREVVSIVLGAASDVLG